ncbi:HIRAN domain-containing protein [Amycolatopsis sp. NPDC051373]|uniref:HIRAN domain-containing protein n=1 Tax=Amycolatopsis sp. NPDC051373 TaxID=3155801 RepID=UPI0034509498
MTRDLTIRRMAVGWQHPVTRAVDAVGLLEFDGTQHRFRYLRRASRVSGFRPFIGFARLDGVYESEALFPLFAQRAMSPRRPDYSQYLRSLDLDDTASTWEQIARTEGRLAGDTIHLVPEPTVGPDGSTAGCFLVAGIRHRMPDQDRRDAILGSLQPGSKLFLRDEPDNPVNPRAILVSQYEKIDIGWVPNMLVEYVHKVRNSGDCRIQVRHVNGAESPVHMRLLAEIRGKVMPGYEAFSGSGWETY